MVGAGDQPRQVKLKWIDNCEDNKEKLRTNNSEDDLVCKLDEDQVTLMDFHRRKDKVPAKSTIKPFSQTISEVTGVPPLKDEPSQRNSVPGKKDD